MSFLRKAPNKKGCFHDTCRRVCYLCSSTQGDKLGNSFTKTSAASATALALGAFIWPPLACAADLTTESAVAFPEEPQWSVAVDPFYGWVPGFNGNARIFNNNVSLDITAGDILGNLSSFIEILDGLYMGSGEARYESFGLQYDVVYLSVAGTSNFSIGSLVGGLDVGFGYSAATFAANYRIDETESGYLDLIAGVRVSDLKTDLTLSLGPTVRASDGDTWVDPVIGVKGRYLIDDNWFVKGWS